MRVDITWDGEPTENFFEVGEKWTRRETRAVEASNLEDMFNIWLPEKVTAMKIVLETGEVITDPKQISWDAPWLDDLDHRLYGIMSNMMYKVLQTLFFSATTNAKMSLDGIVNKASATKTKLK